MNYKKVYVFSTEMFCYVKFLEYSWCKFDELRETYAERM